MTTTLGTPKGRLRQWFDLGGADAMPLFVLFGLNLVDEFDRLAYATLLPEIRDAFSLSDDQAVAIGTVAAVMMLLGALPIGYLGDRFARTRIAGVAAVVWGTMAVLTGVAWVVPVLVVARIGSGIARTSNEVVHPSLLADYYTPAVLPTAIQVHRLAQPFSYVAALLAGGIAAVAGWRWAFIVLAVPTFVFLTMLVRLKEPLRGGSLDLLDDEPAAIESFTFRQARKALFEVRTLRRCWLGGFLLGIALIANGQLLSLFFEDVFDFGPFQRGVVQFTLGLGTVAGIVVGARAARAATAAGRFHGLCNVVGAAFATCAAGLVGMAVTPWWPPAVLVVFAVGVGLGIYQPAYFPLVARIVPPQVRTQAYGYSLMFVGLGALLAIPIARFGERESYRVAFAVLAGIVALGALVITSARRHVAADIERADARFIRTVDLTDPTLPTP